MRRLFAVALFVVAAGAAAEELTETIDRTFDVKPGANVVLKNVNGRVTVASWDQPKVRVIARKEIRADDDNLKEAMKELRVDIQARDGGLVITTKQPKGSDGWAALFSWLAGDHVEAQVKYDITVPRTMNVDVENTNGAIETKSLNGRLDLETTNGSIQVVACSGALEATTTNGSIHAELVRVAKGQPLEFETTNGRIEVTLPSNLAVDVNAETTNGRISSDLPVATTSHSRNSLRGTINGGGTPLRLTTTNGGISIQSGKPAA
ncbi:MAG TPA: DUF4097 family beta strand repeat-containing protein [Thermoanaerobaculia bacterium]